MKHIHIVIFYLYVLQGNKNNVVHSGRSRSLNNLNRGYNASNGAIRNVITDPVPSMMLSKSQSSVSLSESGFKRKAKKVQTTAAVTKAFQNSGNQISLQRWKSLLQ